MATKKAEPTKAKAKEPEAKPKAPEPKSPLEPAPVTKRNGLGFAVTHDPSKGGIGFPS